MPQLLFGKWDRRLREIGRALAAYEAANPGAEVSVYRQNSASVRIRVIDSSFAGLSIGERGKLVWTHLRTLSDDARSDITVLLTLAPEEVESSFANLDFEQPMSSTL